MSTKRKASDFASQSSSPSSKRKRDSKGTETTSSEHSPARQASNIPQQRQQPKNDPRFGQRFAFPGLEDGSEDGSLNYDEGPTDGLEYLRTVR